MKTIGILLFLVSVLHTIYGYPNGAPTTQESCFDLQPIHTNPLTGEQYPNQEDPPPFRIELSTGVYQPCVMPIDCRRAPITVTIRGLSMYFRGFIIQARTQFGGAKAHGQFLRSPDGSSDGVVKTINCPNGQTLTHTSNNDVTSVRFQWIPEPNMKEAVQFVSTVVQTEQTIYTDVKSTEVTAVGVTRTKDKKAVRTNQLPSSSGIPRTNFRQTKMFVLQESPHRPFDYSSQIQRPGLPPSIQQQETVAINQLISPGLNISPPETVEQTNRQITNGRLNNRVPNAQFRGSTSNRPPSFAQGNNRVPNAQFRGSTSNSPQSFAQGNNRVQNTRQLRTNLNTRQSSLRFNNVATSNVNTQSSALQTSNLRTSNNNVGPNNRAPSVGFSTSQRSSKVTFNNNPMVINAAQQPINATNKQRLSVNNMQQPFTIKSNARTKLITSEVNQQPQVMRPTQLSGQTLNNRLKISDGVRQTNVSTIKANSTKFSNLRTMTTRRPTAATIPPVQRSTTPYKTTKTPQAAVSNTMARINNIGSRALTRNNIPAKMDNNDINMKTKPRNSGYTYSTSAILMILPLLVNFI